MRGAGESPLRACCEIRVEPGRVDTDVRSRLLVFAVTALAALTTPAVAAADDLVAIVGPGTNISLTRPDGTRVTHLDPGTHTITVHDRSDVHNFHLIGPGVDRATGVDEIGTETWTVTFRDGTYRYVCDPHATVMRGSFTVGTPPPPPAPRRLVATVGPGFTITLRTSVGAPVRRLRAGMYTIVVRDRSRRYNFHIVCAGVNRKTCVGIVGTVNWLITIRIGASYR